MNLFDMQTDVPSSYDQYVKILPPIKISVLVATIGSRIHSLFPLVVDELMRQAEGLPVHVEWYGDNMIKSTGDKLNTMLRDAIGDYVVFVDDDDMVSEDYIELLLDGIQSNPDVVCIQSIYTDNGENPRPVYYNLAYYEDNNYPSYFERKPDKKCCIRASIAREVWFKNMFAFDDFDFAERVYPLLSSQSVITKPIYFHKYDSNNSKAFR